MKTGLTTCPKSLGITLPIFTVDTINYVPWQIKADPNLLDLHYKSLKIPPDTKINKTIVNALDSLYKQLDLQLAETLDSANKKIDNIREVSTSTLKDIMIYSAFSLSVVNSIALIIVLRLLLRRPYRLRAPPLTEPPPPSASSHSPEPEPQRKSRSKKRKCNTCSRPIKQQELIPLQNLTKPAETQ